MSDRFEIKSEKFILKTFLSPKISNFSLFSAKSEKDYNDKKNNCTYVLGLRWDD